MFGYDDRQSKGNGGQHDKGSRIKRLEAADVQPINIETLKDAGDPVVVMDGVGAGEGEIVMCVGGSSSRAADETKTAPADMTLLAILDSIDIKGRRVYEKYSTEG